MHQPIDILISERLTWVELNQMLCLHSELILRIQVHLLLIYVCNFHVVNNFLLIYICKLHWNLITIFVCQVNFFWFTYEISMSEIIFFWFTYVNSTGTQRRFSWLKWLPKLVRRKVKRRIHVMIPSSWAKHSGGNFLLIYIWNFHILSHLLLIYMCKLHWNLESWEWKS